MQLSKFGQKITGRSGILQLMDDLGTALSADEPVIMMGGGNPSHIPLVQDRLRQHMLNLLDSANGFEHFVGDYSAPVGDTAFVNALADLLSRELGRPIGPQNIALTNGSQSAFFTLFNLFGGEFSDGSFKQILLPLAPEYIGYADVGLQPNLFTAAKPSFEFLGNHLFKYHVNFDDITVDDHIGAICVSRPTNPTGNVLTDNEITHLSALAREHNIPLIVDNAYGTPFPNIIFTDAKPTWDDHIILSMSLSKLGMPAARTGILIANETIIQAIGGMNAVTSLAPGSMGAVLTTDMIRSGEIIQLSREVIGPYYQRKAEMAVAYLQDVLDMPQFYIHKPEGAIFLWLWFKDMPITSQTLYERLKARGVIVVPGEYFFPGLENEDWRHKQECIRVSYAQDEETVRKGLAIIAEEVKRAYR